MVAAPPDAARATVVVLGDLARSPRMCLHALALASAGFSVEVVAYTDAAVPRALEAEKRIRITSLPSRAAPSATGARYLLRVIPTVVARFVDLTRVLWASEGASWVVVQNPPAIPALPVLLLMARRSGVRLVLDWHNFGWTVLGLRVGQGSSAVAVAGWLERLLGRRADLHLCVSEAMRRVLSTRYGIEATVFRDRPAQVFVNAGLEDRRAARRAILSELEIPESVAEDLQGGKGRLLVSSTSWSADEDFSLLLEALQRWAQPTEAGERPHLVVVVSGLGPLRERFENEVARVTLGRVTVRTTWLSESSYPRLLAAADLGVCLHRSTSGVDLPMKLADMEGVGLPACALDYGPCLREARHDGDDGLLFESATELSAIWNRLFVEQPEALVRMRSDLINSTAPTWQENWLRTVDPLLRAESSADLE